MKTKTGKKRGRKPKSLILEGVKLGRKPKSKETFEEHSMIDFGLFVSENSKFVLPKKQKESIQVLFNYWKLMTERS